MLMSGRHSATCYDERSLVLCIVLTLNILTLTKWATTWQNQQCGCAPSEDSDHPGHPPSLIRVFTVCMKKDWVLSYPLSAQRRLWSDWAYAQADLSRRRVHIHLVGFVVRRLKCLWLYWAVKLSLCFLNISLMPVWAFDHHLMFQTFFACGILYLMESDFDSTGLYHFYCCS